jgi:hypothetical protein
LKVGEITVGKELFYSEMEARNWAENFITSFPCARLELMFESLPEHNEFFGG